MILLIVLRWAGYYLMTPLPLSSEGYVKTSAQEKGSHHHLQLKRGLK